MKTVNKLCCLWWQKSIDGGDNLLSRGWIKKIKKGSKFWKISVCIKTTTFVSFFSIHSFTVFIEIRTNPSLEIPTDKYTDTIVLSATVPLFTTKNNQWIPLEFYHPNLSVWSSLNCFFFQKNPCFTLPFKQKNWRKIDT